MVRKRIAQAAGSLLLAATMIAAAPISNLYAGGNPVANETQTTEKSWKPTGTTVKPATKTFDKTILIDTEELSYTQVAENDSYVLYMEDKYLSVIVEDKKTGSYMTSAIEYDDGQANYTWLGAMTSALVLTMISGSDDTKQADLFNDVTKTTVTYTNDGFSADVYWTQYKIGMTLNVSLTDDGLLVSIPDESIVEDGEKFALGTVSIYPYMGSSYMDEKEGYLLVPDGNGALIYLDDKEGRYKNGFSAMIYSSDAGFVESSTEVLLMDRYNTIADAQKVIAPVFGIAHTEDEMAYLAVVEEGEARAMVEVIPNGVSVDYNRAYARFVMRRTYTQPTSNTSTSGALSVYETERSHSELAIRYLFLSGDEANYSGMAVAYRNYLLDRGELVAADTSYNTRVDFMGTERQNFLMGTTAVVMTTVEDAKEIYADLEANGVTDILTIYKGWQSGGLYNLPISKYKAASQIGGTAALTKLIKESEEKGIDIYLYNDALLINPSTKNATFNVVKKVNKRKYEFETYREVYKTMNYLTPTRSAKLLEQFAKSYTKKDVDKLAVAGITNTVFTYNYNSVKYSRYDTQDAYAEAIAALDEQTQLVLEQPAAYLWKNTEAFLDMPMYTSSYVYEDETIPFLSIVLKGVIPVYSEYVNFEANKQEYFLKLVETGSYPSFYITKESSSALIYTNSADIYSSEYSSYQETIAAYNAQLSELNATLDGATIVKHEIPENGCVRVTYSNGVTVYVNYNEKSETVDGITIDAMSYHVEK